jgi:hypothetical protein
VEEVEMDETAPTDQYRLADPPGLPMSANDDMMAMIDRLDLAEPETGAYLDVRDLDNMELATRYSAVQQELLRLGQLLEATTDQGKTLHSEHGALLVELHRRGMR